MSEQNVKSIREAIDAFNQGNIEAALNGMHPEVEWHGLGMLPDAGVHRGPDGVREFWRTWRQTFRDFRLDISECVALSDAFVLTSYRASGEGAHSGAGVASPAFFQLFEFRDDLLVTARMFPTRAQALEAAGMSE